MKSSAPTPRAPGPKGNPFFGRLVAEARRDPLNFMTRLAREYGDVCSFRVGLERVYFVNHPELVGQVLVNHYENFLKGNGRRRARRFLGEGLLLSEGETHRRQRQLAAPAFHRQRLAAYAAEMAAGAERCSDRWRDGQVLDLWPEMLRLTLSIVGRTLFGADVESKDDEVGQAMRAATRQYRAFKLPLAGLLERLPLPHIRGFHRGKERLRRVVLDIIEERRARGADRGDLLDMLLLAEEEGSPGRRMTPEQVWDEALTIFIAGYDTTATALMWTWYLLSQHPEVEVGLHAELDGVLEGGRAARFEDFRRLPLTERVLAEAMRLYPPTWRLVRRAIKDFRAGEYVIPAGALVVTCQYAMHRDPRYFPDPLRFDPGRWTEAFERSLPRFAYFPFGGGPRYCVGQGFASAEAALVLAAVCQRFTFAPDPTFRLELWPSITLRPRDGVRVRVRQRATAARERTSGEAPPV
jgi:cytochrome P450